MRILGIVVIMAVIAACGASLASADYGEYFWVVKGHDIAGTGKSHAGVTPYFSAEDWIVGTPAYTGNGGPDAVRKLPNGKAAPLGRTPTERTGHVRVALAGLEAIGVDAGFNPTSRLAKVDHGGKTMVFLPGSRTALLDGKTVALSDVPTLREGKLYVPVTDVAERLLGMKVYEAVRRISSADAE